MKSALCNSAANSKPAATRLTLCVAAARRRVLRRAGLGLGLALLSFSLEAQAAPDKAAKADAKAPAAPVEMEIPQSVFVIPAGPREGRNPFFPRSTVAAPVQKVKEQPVLDTSNIVLNGVTSKPIPTVMINGVTFEKGEEHEVKVPSGARVKIRCEEIHEESALILVNGLQRELRMRSGL